MTTKQTARAKAPARKAPARARNASAQPTVEERVNALRTEFDQVYQTILEAEIARFRHVGKAAEIVVESVRIQFTPEDWKQLEAGKAIKTLQARSRQWLESQTLNLSTHDQRIRDVTTEINAAVVVAYAGGKPSASPSRKALFDTAKQCRETLGLARKSANAGKKAKASESSDSSESMDIQQALDIVETALRGKNPQAVMRFREWIDKLPYLTQ